MKRYETETNIFQDSQLFLKSLDLRIKICFMLSLSILSRMYVECFSLIDEDN